jgi:DNA (cytosine-5)-methyltransferase 1
VRELGAEQLFAPDAMRIGCEPRPCGDVEYEPMQSAQHCAGQRQNAGWFSGESGGRQAVDLICGGFPCQDISVAGRGAGIEGARSGLWGEYARIIGEVRPRYVIVENVAALLGRGIERVLGDLATLGFDAEWHCIPASSVGAPHRRDRVWIVAFAAGERWRSEGSAIAGKENGGRSFGEPCGTGDVADTRSAGLSPSERQTIFGAGRWEEGRAASECGWWLTESDVGRVAHGIPARIHRLRALGNAIVPQIAEIIGRAIMSNRS